MTREDREVEEMTKAAEFLDTLFDIAERQWQAAAPHCPKHPEHIIYSTGCARCGLIKDNQLRDRRAARYRARATVRLKP